LRWLPVIARNSSFVFRGRPMSVVDMGRLLGARYLLQGSVRVAGDALRVNAALIDAETERNIWSVRYNEKIGNIFEVQDSIVEHIISALNLQINLAEEYRSRTASPQRLDVWGIVHRAMWHQYKLTREDAAKARELLDEALARDPSSLEALVQKSWWYFWDVWTQRGAKVGLIEMEKLARRARLLDSLDARPHMLIGIALLMMREPVRGRAPLLEAIRLNPSLYLAHGSLGTTYILSGDPQLAIDPLLTAMRLNPHDLYMFHAMGELAICQYMLGHWSEALDWCERALDLRPGYWYPRAVRVATLARAGELKAADVALQELRSRHREFSINQVNWIPFVDRKWNEYLKQGLELAGYVP
jgi:tetratricopeptide (TPR) repeat protein